MKPAPPSLGSLCKSGVKPAEASSIYPGKGGAGCAPQRFSSEGGADLRDLGFGVWPAFATLKPSEGFGGSSRFREAPPASPSVSSASSVVK